MGLHFFHAIAELNLGKTQQQTFGILRDAQIPLAQFLFYDKMPTPFTYTIDHFIVG
jgi:hypothetical protein